MDREFMLRAAEWDSSALDLASDSQLEDNL